MKATGIVRNVDNLGRIVIPIELRRTLGIENGDPMEIFVTEDGVTIKKHSSSCQMCGCIEEVVELYPGKSICTGCVEIISKHQGKLLGTTA